MTIFRSIHATASPIIWFFCMWLVAQLCLTLCGPMDYSPPGSSVHGDSLGKNGGVGCHALLQGIFSTQGSNPGLPYCRRILYHLRHQESSRILEWITYPFSRGSSQPKNGTGVSCIAGEFFTSWTTREAPFLCTPDCFFYMVLYEESLNVNKHPL